MLKLWSPYRALLAASDFRLMGFLFKLMGFLFKLMGFLFKLMGFLFELMGFLFSQGCALLFGRRLDFRFFERINSADG